jgi:cytochrome c oxidase subunit II
MHSALQALGVHAQHIDVVWRTMLWVCGFMYLIVIVFLVHAIWRRRESRSDTPRGMSSPTARSSMQPTSRR